MSPAKPLSTAQPLDTARLRELLVEPGSLWRQIEVVAETGSTNADLSAKGRNGAVGGSVLLTEHQSAGRGRLNRTWTAPAGSGIAMSILVRPQGVATQRWTWLPLIAGVAVVEALRRPAGVPSELKWPNDVLVNGRKLCGILAERVETPQGPACVIGMGLNVTLAEADLPVPTATSLLLESAKTTDRNTLATTILRAFEMLYRHWETSDDDAALAASYVSRCSTIGKEVCVILDGERTVSGRAEAIDDDGRLVVRTTAGLQTFGAGDVVHLR